MMGTMEIREKQEEWCRWLQGVLEEKLAGCGVRVEVAFVAEEGLYRIAVICPLEWKVTCTATEDAVKEEGETALLDAAVQMAEAVRRFALLAWPDRLRDIRAYELWRDIPGSFEWITEQAPEILYRVTMQELHRRFGRRCVKEITLCEDLLVVHTRWAGNYCIGFNDYRRSLENAAGTIAGYMRKPIRNEYLKELRNGKNRDKGQD